MGYGDEVIAAGQAQRIYDADPTRRVSVIDINGKPRWHPIWEGNPIIAPPTAVEAGEDVHRLLSAPHARPYIVYPFTVSSGWTFNKAFQAREHIAKIYLTKQELTFGRRLKAEIGPYVLIEPWSKHENLRWPFAFWEELVERRHDLRFVQHTHSGTVDLVTGAIPIPASFREACGLAVSSDLYVRGESGMLHAAAALDVPTVAIWGGCMDWDVLGGYPTQIGLLNYTVGSPCGRWIPCVHCRESMAGISVEAVSEAMTRMRDRGLR